MRPGSVLLVEDNVDDVYLTRRILHKAGVEVITVAGDGQEALEMLLPDALPLPGMVIIDLRLPRVSGLKLLAELRRQERTMALPVLILTSSDDPNDREACLKLGALAFLSKPLELNDLQQVFCGLSPA
ncbi:MAG: putative response regulator [Deltaproteobacteria bacterium]|nr:putative response regulator [Deltaproteobacteria bacterium]